ncbi:AlkA N-terminal domain-containing protein [Actinotalea sp. AC32]|nr:AlkA N-terminal domain-containing protein [Actinotalea sp. AC32]
MGVRTQVELAVGEPFDAPGVLGFLGARAVAGVEVAELPGRGPLRYARTVTLPGGPGAVEVVARQVGVAGSRPAWRVHATVEVADEADVGVALDRVHRLLDLGADPRAVDAALAADPVLAPLVSRTPGIRVPGTVDPHELVLRALVGQQISVAAARTHLSRLARVAGEPYASSVPGLDRLFPSPDRVVAAVRVPSAAEDLDPERPLRLPRRALGTVVTTCGALADGDLVVDAGVGAAALRRDLVARPGIGPWTAAYVAMRVLGDPDAWLDGDVALLAGARSLGVLDGDVTGAAAHRLLAVRAARWAPWRSYAAMHVWRAAVPAAPPSTTTRQT